MAVRPLRPATDRSLGGPLPRQLANRTRAHLQAPGLTVPGFDPEARSPRVLCGISTSFPMLFPTRRKITHALLTRSLLSWGLPPLSAQLACVRHAASVDSEPGSNSPVKTVSDSRLVARVKKLLRAPFVFKAKNAFETQKIACTCLVFKEPSAVWGLSQNIENG